ATKTGRCVVSTAEPHLAYDCSTLALKLLKSIVLIQGIAKTCYFLDFIEDVRFYFEAVNYGQSLIHSFWSLSPEHISHPTTYPSH
uniref:hypothetical protein n=2 Tax=Lacticaseibacillus rhamnosus TaxID=47715 RepID=UPI0019D39B51